MDDKTRDYARLKAQSANKMLGYPEYILDAQKLDQHYENVRPNTIIGLFRVI